MSEITTTAVTYLDGDAVAVRRSGEELIVRSFAAEVTSSEGRTVDCRIVPYGEQIEHNDGFGGVPVGVPYTEEWAPGAFKHQERAAHRVLANVEHEQGILGVVGRGLALMERQDGLYGSFKLYDTPGGNNALELIRDGVLDQVSLEVPPHTVTNRKGPNGLVRRVRADLRGVAFSRFGAYVGAQILAVRQAAIFEEEELPEEFRPVTMDPKIIERVRSLGLQLPDRYTTAHPDVEGTPAETGTPSEVDTRLRDHNNATSQEETWVDPSPNSASHG